MTKYTEQEVRYVANECAEVLGSDWLVAQMLTAYADLLSAQPVSESPLSDFLRELHGRYPNWWAQFKSADLNKLDRLMLAAPAQLVAVPDGWRDDLAIVLGNIYQDAEDISAVPIKLRRAVDRLRAMLAAAPSPAAEGAKATTEESSAVAQPAEVLSDCLIIKLAKEHADEEDYGCAMFERGSIIEFARAIERAALAQRQGRGAGLLKKIQSAINSVEVPVAIPPVRAEYYKAGARAVIAKINAAIAASTKGGEA